VTTINDPSGVGPRIRILLGFFALNDAAPYLQSVGVSDLDHRALCASHAIARGHVVQIAARAETSVTPVPASSHLADLRAEPTFTEITTHYRSYQFATVEIARLVACQPKVDWDHVERLMSRVPRPGDEEGVRRFCLPLQRDVPSSHVMTTFNPSTRTLWCVVDNLDLRVCGPLEGWDTRTGRSHVGFAIGGGLHQMSVVLFKGRYFMNNGTHRAVALARAGHDRIPVVLLDAHTLDQTPMSRHAMFSPDVALGPTPPRIEDFASPAAVDFATRRMRLLFSVHAETHELPG
jgi:hypothetical protein